MITRSWESPVRSRGSHETTNRNTTERNGKNNAMAYEIQGRVKSVGEAKQVTERFVRRELVIETGLDTKYPQVHSLETSGDRNALLDEVSTGDTVTIQFDLRGREGRDGRVWNTLSIWKIKVDEKSASAGGQQSWGAGNSESDIPFASCDIADEPSGIAKVLR